MRQRCCKSRLAGSTTTSAPAAGGAAAAAMAATAAAAAALAPSAAPQPCCPAAMDPANVHILLVDDERLSRVVVANLLRKCNYRGAGLLRAAMVRGWRGWASWRERVAVPTVWPPPCLAVTVAESGSEALAALQQQAVGTFQLVLTVRGARGCGARTLRGAAGRPRPRVPRARPAALLRRT